MVSSLTRLRFFFSMLANVVGHFLGYQNKLGMVLKIPETWLAKNINNFHVEKRKSRTDCSHLLRSNKVHLVDFCTSPAASVHGPAAAPSNKSSIVTILLLFASPKRYTL